MRKNVTAATTLTTTPVYFEEGAKSVFAVALDWPGWARRAPTAEGALDALDEYRERYRKIVGSLTTGALEVIGSVPGNATTDFGAPSTSGPWDIEAMTSAERTRHVDILVNCWSYFDDVVSHAPAQLRKGPRGGGRDRDKAVDHVANAERAYASKIGAPLPPRTPWITQREEIVAKLSEGNSNSAWPARYAIRRMAWHVVDHAWEIEDKS